LPDDDVSSAKEGSIRSQAKVANEAARYRERIEALKKKEDAASEHHQHDRRVGRSPNQEDAR